MMKSLALLSVLAASASAFAPQPEVRPSPALQMSETTGAAKEKVPCFGATPLLGDNRVFFGENYWDKLTMEYGSAETGQYLQAAELKRKSRIVCISNASDVMLANWSTLLSFQTDVAP